MDFEKEVIGIIEAKELTSIEKYTLLGLVTILYKRGTEEPTGITLEQIAEYLGVTKRTASYRIEELVKAEVLVKIQTGQLPNGKKLPMKYEVYNAKKIKLGVI